MPYPILSTIHLSTIITYTNCAHRKTVHLLYSDTGITRVFGKGLAFSDVSETVLAGTVGGVGIVVAGSDVVMSDTCFYVDLFRI